MHLLKLRWLSGALLLAAVCWAVLPAQTPTTSPAQTPAATAGAPVTVNGLTLFELRERAGQFTPTERAAIISQRIDHLAHNPFRQNIAITVVNTSDGTDIIAAGQPLLTVTETEAQLNGQPRAQLAQDWATRISQTVNATQEQRNFRTLFKGLGLALVATILLSGLFGIINWTYRRLVTQLETGRNRFVRWARMEKLPVLHHERVKELLLVTLRLSRIALWLLLLSFYLPLVFSFFPWTRSLANRLVSYAVTPLAELWERLLDYLPNLFFIIVIAGLTWGAVKLAKIIFWEIERGVLKINGFEREWAHFTYKIVAFLLIVGGVIVAYPYFPGSESPAFRGVSLFLGVLFSLASSSAISNVIAGIILTYTGAFKLGDRVRIGDVLGDVSERTLLVTRLTTIKNEEVSIPNSVVLNGQVTNYTALARGNGLILHTTVTIGYNTPWRQVHDLLMQAALATQDIANDPAPFVLQTSLNDYHISYELNAATRNPAAMVNIYSELHQQIQDKFNAAGVEIMSPAYTSLRDGNAVTISAEHVAPNYRSPGFKVEIQS